MQYFECEAGAGDGDGWQVVPESGFVSQSVDESCKTASKDRPKESFTLSIDLANIRWPDDDTGINSVAPSTIPRIIAVKYVM
jgi:hypothetical protein